MASFPTSPASVPARLAALSALGLAALLGGALASQDDAATDPSGPGVSTSERCAMCHAASDDATAMRDGFGRPIAPFDLWRSTMMANSARDPFWRAVMSAEIAATPSAEDAIIAKCLKCHTPLADQVGLEDHGSGSLAHALDCEGELGDLARDGVSCTICHGIAPDGLGTDASFSANFVINQDLRLFGPHDEVFPRPMQMMAGFTPHYGAHVTQSKLCGTCHTLETHALDAEGNATGETLAEQTPYLEWRNSVFSNEGVDGDLLEDAPAGARTCQSCHMPTIDQDGRRIRTRIAHNPGGFDFPFLEPRAPFGRHLLVGGNAFMLTMLRDNAEALGVAAPKEAFDATIAATREQLEKRSAQLAIEPVAAEGAPAAFEVAITNLTGHKLPTGHPARRMWLEVVVEDAGGNVLLASGRPNDEGLILGGDGAVLPTERRGGPVEPHRAEVTSSDEVARFRAIMADANGDPTFLLIRGGSWLIDDRVFPRGWRPDHADAPRTLAYGTGDDPSYLPEAAGSDGRARVRYLLPEGSAAPRTVRARLLYQTVSPRYVDEIAAYETPEIERFLAMYRAADRAPEVLAEAVWGSD